MNQPLISIILPVYNTEMYVGKCIESIMEQSFKDFELIIIDDGSTDDSLLICQAWSYDERVHITSTENHGVSYARNMGLKQASGKWVMFVDSDDCLLENCLEKLQMLTVADVQEISATYITGKKQEQQMQSAEVQARFVMEMSLDAINNKLLPDFYELEESTLHFCTCKLYLNEIIKKKGLQFKEGLRLSEDHLFHIEYLSCIEKVMVTNLPVYFYRIHGASTTRNFKSSYYEDRIQFFEILKKFNLNSYDFYVISTMLLFACKVEKYLDGSRRKSAEQKITRFFLENADVVYGAKEKILSKGKWQRLVYKVVVYCLLGKWNGISFLILRLYTKVSRGEI